MAKKPKKLAALNWRTGEGYPEYKSERTDLWAWEFLRRNPDYRADWLHFLAVADELRGGYRKPYDNLPDDWESDPGRPYWIISKAWGDGDMRAAVLDPPALPGETEDEYCKRMHAKGCGWVSHPLAGAMGSKWGLDSIADPTLLHLGLNHKWEVSPHGIKSPGAHRHNKEATWVYYLNHLAETLRPDPLPPSALQEARTLLEQIPAAWIARHEEMRGENHPEKRGRYVLEFDLRASIPEQLKHAKGWLEWQQSRWKEGGGTVWSDGRKNKETPGYATYLRALDAIEEIGEASIQQWRKEIAAAMMPSYPADATHDVRKSYLDSASAWVKRAKRLRDGEYRRLVAMAIKPTLADIERDRQRKK